ncbi:hypothetical protein ACQKPE_04325 [Pseudomonas sp. NPDC089554]|uniref:hypothetical protein n=1 Tax=Pseudomonas sp. NPDC089554 TaxID=3390653 RepID=UPI003D034C46
MIIDSKNWSARQEGNQLYVEGTVTVGHPGIEPLLELSEIQDRSSNLNLDLKTRLLEGGFLQVVTEKQVVFEMTVDYPVPEINVRGETAMITSIAVESSEA